MTFNILCVVKIDNVYIYRLFHERRKIPNVLGRNIRNIKYMLVEAMLLQMPLTCHQEEEEGKKFRKLKALLKRHSFNINIGYL